MQRLRLLSLLGAAALALVALAAWGQSSITIATVATFTPPDLPEGITLDRQGTIYLSLAPTGEVRTLRPDGTQATQARFRVGMGFLLGLTTDGVGSLYAAVASFDAPDTDSHGVWRVRPDGAQELVAALPATGVPNDLKFDARGTLFVSDSGLGVIWRIDLGSGTATRWLEHRLLQGHGELTGPACPGVDTPFSIGANGLAFAPNGDLLVAVTDFGRILRVPVAPDGSAGTPQVVVDDCATLGGADGLAVDRAGAIFVAVNTRNTVVRVGPTGAIETVATAADGLDSPASLIFDGAGRLLVTNFAVFAFLAGGSPKPSVIRITLPPAQAPAGPPTKPTTGGERSVRPPQQEHR